MAPRTNRRLLILRTLALLTGLSGGFAKADPLYTVTDLGSGPVNLTTPSGGTIAVSPDTLPPTYSIVTSQLTSISNGQVSYSFATTPDTPLVQGQGPLSGVTSSSLGTAGSIYGPTEEAGLMSANGFAALVATERLNADPTLTYETAFAGTLNPDGTLGGGKLITSSPNSTYNSGGITIAGVNMAGQALLWTWFSGTAYDALVYNVGTHTLTDLDSLPAITAGGFSNLEPIAIDNSGQVLVLAPFEATARGYGTDILLLTPGDAPPVPLATPEPGSCVLWAVIACASYVAAKRAEFIR